jgi:hypothetical protein
MKVQKRDGERKWEIEKERLVDCGVMARLISIPQSIFIACAWLILTTLLRRRRMKKTTSPPC